MKDPKEQRPLQPQVPQAQAVPPTYVGDNPFVNYQQPLPIQATPWYPQQNAFNPVRPQGPGMQQQAQPQAPQPQQQYPYLQPHDYYAGEQQYYGALGNELLSKLQGYNPMDAEHSTKVKSMMQNMADKHMMNMLKNPNERFQSKQYLNDYFEFLKKDPRFADWHNIIDAQAKTTNESFRNTEEVERLIAEEQKNIDYYPRLGRAVNADLKGIVGKPGEENLLTKPSFENFSQLKEFFEESGLTFADRDKLFSEERGPKEGLISKLFRDKEHAFQALQRASRGLEGNKFWEGVKDEKLRNWAQKHYKGEQNKRFDADLRGALQTLFDEAFTKQRLEDRAVDDKKIDRYEDELLQDVRQSGVPQKVVDSLGNILTEALRAAELLPKTLGEQPQLLEVYNYLRGQRATNDYIQRFFSKNSLDDPNWPALMEKDFASNFLDFWNPSLVFGMTPKKLVEVFKYEMEDEKGKLTKESIANYLTDNTRNEGGELTHPETKLQLDERLAKRLGTFRAWRRREAAAEEAAKNAPEALKKNIDANLNAPATRINPKDQHISWSDVLTYMGEDYKYKGDKPVEEVEDWGDVSPSKENTIAGGTAANRNVKDLIRSNKKKLDLAPEVQKNTTSSFLEANPYIEEAMAATPANITKQLVNDTMADLYNKSDGVLPNEAEIVKRLEEEAYVPARDIALKQNDTINQTAIAELNRTIDSIITPLEVLTNPYEVAPTPAPSEPSGREGDWELAPAPTPVPPPSQVYGDLKKICDILGQTSEIKRKALEMEAEAYNAEADKYNQNKWPWQFALPKMTPEEIENACMRKVNGVLNNWGSIIYEANGYDRNALSTLQKLRNVPGEVGGLIQAIAQPWQAGIAEINRQADERDAAKAKADKERAEKAKFDREIAKNVTDSKAALAELARVEALEEANREADEKRLKAKREADIKKANAEWREKLVSNFTNYMENTVKPQVEELVYDGGKALLSLVPETVKIIKDTWDIIVDAARPIMTEEEEEPSALYYIISAVADTTSGVWNAVTQSLGAKKGENDVVVKAEAKEPEKPFATNPVTNIVQQNAEVEERASNISEMYRLEGEKFLNETAPLVEMGDMAALETSLHDSGNMTTSIATAMANVTLAETDLQKEEARAALNETLQNEIKWQYDIKLVGNATVDLNLTEVNEVLDSLRPQHKMDEYKNMTKNELLAKQAKWNKRLQNAGDSTKKKNDAEMALARVSKELREVEVKQLAAQKKVLLSNQAMWNKRLQNAGDSTKKKNDAEMALAKISKELEGMMTPQEKLELAETKGQDLKSQIESKNKELQLKKNEIAKVESELKTKRAEKSTKVAADIAKGAPLLKKYKEEEKRLAEDIKDKQALQDFINGKTDQSRVIAPEKMKSMIEALSKQDQDKLGKVVHTELDKMVQQTPALKQMVAKVNAAGKELQNVLSGNASLPFRKKAVEKIDAVNTKVKKAKDAVVQEMGGSSVIEARDNFLKKSRRFDITPYAKDIMGEFDKGYGKNVWTGSQMSHDRDITGNGFMPSGTRDRLKQFEGDQYSRYIPFGNVYRAAMALPHRYAVAINEQLQAMPSTSGGLGAINSRGSVAYGAYISPNMHSKEFIGPLRHDKNALKADAADMQSAFEMYASYYSLRKARDVIVAAGIDLPEMVDYNPSGRIKDKILEVFKAIENIKGYPNWLKKSLLDPDIKQAIAIAKENGDKDPYLDAMLEATKKHEKALQESLNTLARAIAHKIVAIARKRSGLFGGILGFVVGGLVGWIAATFPLIAPYIWQSTSTFLGAGAGTAVGSTTTTAGARIEGEAEADRMIEENTKNIERLSKESNELDAKTRTRIIENYKKANETLEDKKKKAKDEL